MKHIVEVAARPRWSIQRDSGSGVWVAVADEMGLTVSARTFKGLVKVISEAIRTLMADLFLSGELTSFMAERGWSLRSPLPGRQSRVHFDVPFDLALCP